MEGLITTAHLMMGGPEMRHAPMYSFFSKDKTDVAAENLKYSKLPDIPMSSLSPADFGGTDDPYDTAIKGINLNINDDVLGELMEYVGILTESMKDGTVTALELKHAQDATKRAVDANTRATNARNTDAFIKSIPPVDRWGLAPT